MADVSYKQVGKTFLYVFGQLWETQGQHTDIGRLILEIVNKYQKLTPQERAMFWGITSDESQVSTILPGIRYTCLCGEAIECYPEKSGRIMNICQTCGREFFGDIIAYILPPNDRETK